MFETLNRISLKTLLLFCFFTVFCFSSPLKQKVIRPEKKTILRGYTIPVIDLAGEKNRQVIVDKEKGRYLGHPTTVLLEDGKTMIAVYPKGHGRGAIVMKRSTDGGLTWGEPEVIAEHPKAHLCEPGVVRSPGGRQLAMLMRENSRRYNSFVSFSNDEGATWTVPVELTGSLTGDRHTACYTPDGTIVTTTYGHWIKGEQPFIVSVRLKLEELDKKAAQINAAKIFKASGVKGGLVVKLGCEDPELVANLHGGDGYIVQALDTDAGMVAKTRGHLQAMGIYGPVSAERFDGQNLPYIDNLVNLVVAEDLGKVTLPEVMRVLAPEGVLCVKQKQDGKWKTIVKPRPAGIDEWTHYLHGPDNNAVAQDTVIGPPRHLQWVGGPRWSRHHEHLSSMNAMVSAGGRIFYIIDEGSRASIQLPAKWKLVARDAFNGTILWKKDIPRWYVHTYPLKSGPADLPRRLVASSKCVYVPLGIDQPLSALDAATGRIIRTYKETKAAEEVVLSNGMLFVLVNRGQVASDHFKWDQPICWWVNHEAIYARAWNRTRRMIFAVDADSGKVAWKKQYIVAPITLAVDKKHVVFDNGKRVICLNRETGEKLWTSEPVGIKSLPLPTQFAPTLVLYDDVVLYSGGNGKMTSFDAQTGRKLWTAPHYRSGHMSPEDLLVVGGLAWTGGLADRAKNNIWTGYDIKTGEVKKEFPPDIKSYWFHHRCYRCKATVNYFLSSRTGIEFVDWRKGTWLRNHWVRGSCIYGIMPANGLVYAPQQPCVCYMETKLDGLNVLAPARGKEDVENSVGSDEGNEVKPGRLKNTVEKDRLGKGPAYGKIPASKTGQEDWPVYRCNNQRSGFVKTKIGADLKPAWQTALGGRLSSLTVSCGRCFVASIDKHTVHALDAKTGNMLWTFTAGGRVDSPPSIYKGRAVFGCTDGYVYCLRASDGVLAWRYQVAPNRRQHVAYNQIESVWPLHGSVLVQNGIAYCLAGRTAFLDGGMSLCLLDVQTGRLESKTIIDHRVPGTDKDLQTLMKGLNMPTALPDILSCDGKSVYLRSQAFDLSGKRRTITVAHNPADQVGENVHLFSNAGFLDGSWFHRAYWLYGKEITSGCDYWFRAGHFAPAGRIMVFDDDMVYGYGRQPHYFVWTPALEYRIFAVARNVTQEGINRVKAGNRKLDKRNTRGPWFKSDRWIFNREATAKLSRKELSAVDEKWSLQEPKVIVRAMALAGRRLFVAGPPDLLNEEDAVRRRFDPDVQKQIIEQDAALAGKRGGFLLTISAENGQEQSELKLDAIPVWDGMAAAEGRLYLVTTNGKVTCFTSKEKK